MKKDIKEMLLNLNLDSSLSGYEFIKYGIEIVVADKWYYKGHAENRLYPDIAKKFGVSKGRVKVAIAYAIKKSGSKKKAIQYIFDLVERME